MTKLEIAMTCVSPVIIAAMSAQFDSHAFIDVFRKAFPNVYKDLAEEFQNSAPANRERDLNAQIALWLARNQPAGIHKSANPPRQGSVNIHGNDTENQVWEK